MKKVLFATTALIATAGIASAQGVTLSGSAEMGVIGGDRLGDDNDDLQFHTDIDVTFTMSGTTDGGLVFGANIDLDESSAFGEDEDGDDLIDTIGNNAFNNTTQGGESIFVSGDLGTLTMGDTDGAFDRALQEAAIGGSINDDHTEHAGYSGNSGLDGTYDGQIARYDYTFGDFSFSGSLEIDDEDEDGDDDDDPVIGIGGTYNGDFGTFTLGIGIGYQTVSSEDDDEDRDIYGISADFGFGDFRAILNYSDLDGASGFDDHYAIALGYTADALTVGVNYGEFNGDDDASDADGYGIAVDYDLGGGAELQFGYGDGGADDEDDVDSYSFGISLTF